ncbi:hypothetical protein ACF3NA_04670 [Alkanindiges sp. WGS2144]|uniref:hypothetical protein n=1 Tax=Alkanindiges sp. WGS2144 TaxID=3366808 RepID=UPI003750A938
MNKLLGLLPVALLLGACTTTDGTMNPTASTANNIGMAVFQTAVDQKCRTELNNRNEYKILTSVLTSEKKQDIENQVCGCVGEEAAKNVTMVELAQAAIDPQARAVLIANTVNNTLSTCITKFKF